MLQGPCGTHLVRSRPTCLHKIQTTQTIHNNTRCVRSKKKTMHHVMLSLPLL